MKRKLLLFLLSALGFQTACDSEEKETPVMYGTPTVSYLIQGKVVDPAGTPIPGIKVASPGDQKVKITDSEGRYRLEEPRNYSGRRVLLTFTDIDGAENGGLFADKQVEIHFEENERTGQGDGGWYVGSFAREEELTTLEHKTE